MIKEIIKFLEIDGSEDFIKEISLGNLTVNAISKLITKHKDKPIKELLSLNIIRNKCRNRIDNVDNFIFTAKGSQQASSTALAKYHAKKLENYSTIADLCCGNGIDLFYISKNKKQVFALDLDEETLLAAKYNNRKEQNITFLQEKAEEFSNPVSAIFVDPDRRDENKRFIAPEDLSPKLSNILKLTEITPNILVKLSPAMDYKSIIIKQKHSYEFISENGELKEILLCLGNFANDGNKAILLPKNISLLQNKKEIAISGTLKYILEPDSAIIRAGLVQDLGYEIGTTLLNKHLALLSSNKEIFSDFTKTYLVVDQFDYNLKKLKKYLRQANIGKLVIKTRGFSQSVEEFRKKLKLKGNESSIMFIIRINEGHKIIFSKLL